MKPLSNYILEVFRPRRKTYMWAGIVFVLGFSFNPLCRKIKGNIEFPYNMIKPDREFKLERNLTEVSGLSFHNDQEVALIQDEAGEIFFFSLEKNQVTKTIRFSKKGDYEDLKVMGDSAYVLRSDGRLVEVTGLDNGPVQENNLNTPLSGKNNTEGLCYDERKNLFLIACKGKPEINKNKKDLENKKAIYSFDPVTKILSDTPYVAVDVNEVQKFARGAYANVIEKLIHFYTKAGAVRTFEPSGIAIHPFTRELYIISSVGKVLVIISPDGHLVNVIQLSAKEFKQPEGIAFNSEGDLFITNEGKQGKGNILEFNMINNKPKLPDL